MRKKYDIKPLKNQILSRINFTSETHSIDHINRVLGYALKIMKKEGGDPEIITASVCIHDLSRNIDRRGPEHGLKSAEMAKEILKKINFPREKIEKVCECIALHDDKINPKKRKTIESQILYDADNLDIFGPVGVARIFVEGGRRGKSITSVVRWWKNGGLRKRYNNMYTKIGKNMAKNAYKWSDNFFSKLDKITR